MNYVLINLDTDEKHYLSAENVCDLITSAKRAKIWKMTGVEDSSNAGLGCIQDTVEKMEAINTPNFDY